MKYAIAIDPGKTGSIVVIDEKNTVTVHNVKQVGKEIDIQDLAEFLLSYCVDSYCVIEDVHSIFGAGAKSNFQFGRALGIVEGIVSTLGIPYTKVTPKVWQLVMWQGIKPVLINTGKKKKDGSVKHKVDTKATSQLAAKRLFPNVNFVPTARSSKDHGGAIDASLMALYCKRNF